MTQNPTFWRKVVYVSLIGLMAIPLSLLGRPASRGTGEDRGSEGGLLAQTRAEYDLGQSALGEIDPASETMKLATLGMKGIAAMVLWEQANRFKDEENWEAFSATVNQISKLQPNFVKVWEFQAHNISYNVSVEFDDYQGRYDWVKKGFQFLVRGLAYNRESYALLRSLGTYFGFKIGRSDESLQFRHMFRSDTDYHEELRAYIPMDDDVKTLYGPDNWLVSRQWFLQAENKVREGAPLSTNTSHLMFYREAPSQFRNAAMDLEKEFRPDEPARRLWEQAFDAWNVYGNRLLKTSWETQLKLNDKQVQLEQVRNLEAELDEFAPGERQRQLEILRQEIDPGLLEAYDTPAEERSPRQMFMAVEAYNRLHIDDQKIADAVPEAMQDEAYRVLRRLQLARLELTRIEQYRNTVNYLYWFKRCEAEQTLTNLHARSAMYDAMELDRQGVISSTEIIDQTTGEVIRVEPGPIEKYEESFELWAKIFRDFPELVDGVTADEMIEWIERYRNKLEQAGEPFPEPFVLDFMFERAGLGSLAEQIDAMEQGVSPEDTITTEPGDITPVVIPIDPNEIGGGGTQGPRIPGVPMNETPMNDGSGETPEPETSEPETPGAEEPDGGDGTSGEATTPSEPAANEPATTEPSATEPTVGDGNR
ncbi:MAG: hypothetical protein KDA83_16140 [Planctomycetales bacterium]|nr:hypothetical protein [Planctomycetales bacterium]